MAPMTCVETIMQEEQTRRVSNKREFTDSHGDSHGYAVVSCQPEFKVGGEAPKREEVFPSKFFFIVSSLSGVRVDFLANFGFSSKAMNKRHH